MEPQEAYEMALRNQQVYDAKQAEFDLAHQAKQAQIYAESLRSQRIWKQKNLK